MDTDLGSEPNDTPILFLKEIFEKVKTENSKSMKNYPASKKINIFTTVVFL